MACIDSIRPNYIGIANLSIEHSSGDAANPPGVAAHGWPPTSGHSWTSSRSSRFSRVPTLTSPTTEVVGFHAEVRVTASVLPPIRIRVRTEYDERGLAREFTGEFRSSNSE